MISDVTHRQVLVRVLRPAGGGRIRQWLPLWWQVRGQMPAGGAHTQRWLPLWWQVLGQMPAGGAHILRWWPWRLQWMQISVNTLYPHILPQGIYALQDPREYMHSTTQRVYALQDPREYMHCKAPENIVTLLCRMLSHICDCPRSYSTDASGLGLLLKALMLIRPHHHTGAA